MPDFPMQFFRKFQSDPVSFLRQFVQKLQSDPISFLRKMDFLRKIQIKQYLIAVNVLLALMCLIALGQLTARIIESTLLQIPGKDIRFTPPEIAKEKKIYSTNDFNTILEQNVFDVQIGEEKPVEEIAIVTPAEEPDAQLKKLLANLQLKGIVMMESGGLAVIYDKQSRKDGVFGIGEEVFQAGTKLHKIEEKKVWISLGNSLGALEYPVDDKVTGLLNQTVGGKKPTQPQPATSKKKMAPLPQRPGKNQTEFSLKAKEIDDALSNFSKLIMQARVVPYMKGGQHIGYQIKKIERGSLYERVGLRNYDVIKKVNGDTINSPEKAMNLFKVMRNEREIALEIERQNKTLVLNYHIN